MREITASQIKDTIKTLFININYEIGDNVLSSLKCALDREVSPVGKAILSQIIENDIIAKTNVSPCVRTPAWPLFLLRLGKMFTSRVEILLTQ